MRDSRMTGIIDFYCVTAVQRTQNVCDVPVLSPKKQIIIVLLLDMHSLLVILLSNQIKRENVLLNKTFHKVIVTQQLHYPILERVNKESTQKSQTSTIPQNVNHPTKNSPSLKLV